MLATLQIEFDFNDKKAINFSCGSLFHGALMEILNTDYAEFLHSQPLNPYSQFVYFDKDKNNFVWQISTLTKDAKTNIIDHILNNIGTSIKLSHNNLELKLKNKNIINIQSYKELADKCFLNENKKNVKTIHLLTPTTYKSENEYQLFPTVSALYTSLYKKWNVFCENISLADKDTFAHIITHSMIIQYNLKSYRYDIEKVHLHSFIGDFKLLLKGPKELISISDMLLEYAQYAGLGAKTSMGMGGVRICQ